MGRARCTHQLDEHHLDRSGALPEALRQRWCSRFHSTGTILPDAYADITNGTAAVPPRTLGEANRGLLVALPGMLLPDSSQPHPIRQPINIAVCSALFRSDEAIYSGARHYTIVEILTRVVWHPHGVLESTRRAVRIERPRRYCETLNPARSSSCGSTASALHSGPEQEFRITPTAL